MSSTRIQSVVVPLLTTPQNILMKSQTGSGKTMAYLIPLLNDLMGLSPAVKRGRHPGPDNSPHQGALLSDRRCAL